MPNPQLNSNGELKHLLALNGLPKDILNYILDTASSFVSVSDREVKKVPLMRGKSVFNLFFRKFDPYPDDFRNRRQTPVGRRHQPEHCGIQYQQGGNAAGYGR